MLWSILSALLIFLMTICLRVTRRELQSGVYGRPENIHVMSIARNGVRGVSTLRSRLLLRRLFISGKHVYIVFISNRDESITRFSFVD